MNKSIILGTAGHIDHGKTTLIKKLTGIDTDRLKEEKARGITIELGFAHIDLPNGIRLGIIDVPGHERFVKNMVAGASTIDLVALIVAGDEGVMPQTVEHLEICSLLGVKSGLVIITKIDLIDDEFLELVKEDVEDFVKGTFLEGAPIVPVSSTTGQGIPELIQTLSKLAEETPGRSSHGVFRMPIDRVFTMKGFGTVVTGTTISGTISTGNEVMIYPKEIEARIRGLQVHNEERDQVAAGMRTAINLQGVERSQIERGDVLSEPNSLLPTNRIEVKLYYLSSAKKPLKDRTQVRFHIGTAEILARILLYEKDLLLPGEETYAVLLLQAHTVALPGDHFVLRSYSPIYTVGGGKILNVLVPPRKKRSKKEIYSRLSIFENGTPADIISELIKENGLSGLSIRDLHKILPYELEDLKKIVKELTIEEKLILFDPDRNIYLHHLPVQEISDKLQQIILRYHKENPMKPGIPKEELRSQLSINIDPKFFNKILQILSDKGILKVEMDLVRDKSHSISLNRRQKQLLFQLKNLFIAKGLTPPTLKELSEKFGRDLSKDLLDLLVQDGVLVKVKGDLYFSKEAVESLKKRLIDFLKERGEISTPEFKKLTGVSRKFTIPLIEFFDQEQITIRVGDKRLLRKNL